MGLIGDIYYAFRGDGARLQKDAQVEGAKSGTVLAKSMAGSFKQSWSGSNIGKGLVQGLGLAGGLGAVTLVSGAITKFVDILGDATQAAIQDEESVSRLAASLKANVKDWDGNTDAIEDNILAKQRLGFDDETLRDSLAVLVGATHDVTKAQQIQNTAMDLARFKRIDLKTASEALIKVEGGVYRSLKQLGIKLKDNATSTEALAAVQAVARGQAEAYAKTNAGKLAASQIKLDEALEHFGATTMPVVVEAMVLGGEAAENLATAWDVATGSAKATSPEIEQLSVAINLAKKGIELETFAFRTLIGIWQTAIGVVSNLTDAITFWDNAADDAAEAAARMSDHSADDIEKLKGSAVADLAVTEYAFDDVGDAADDMAKDVKSGAASTAQSVETMKDDIVDSAQKLIDQAFDPIITHDRLMATNAEIAAQKRIIASGTASKAEIRDAKTTLHSAQKDQAEYVLALARAGQTGSKAYRTAISELRTSVKNATGPTKTYLQGVLNKIDEIKRKGKYIPINLIIQAMNAAGGQGKRPEQHRASGGPVIKDRAYIVGEKRPELFVPNANGRIIARVPSTAQVPSSAGSGDLIQHINLPTTARPDPFEVADRLRWLNDFGVLGRPPSVGGPG